MAWRINGEQSSWSKPSSQKAGTEMYEKVITEITFCRLSEAGWQKHKQAGEVASSKVLPCLPSTRKVPVDAMKSE